jgi:hypothetical protein
MAEYQKSAVAISDLKNSALYFDHLIPVFIGLEVVTSGWLDRDDWQDMLNDVLKDLMPPGFLSPRAAEALGEVNSKMYNMLQKLAIRQHGFEPRISGLSQEEFDDVETIAAHAYWEFVNEFHLTHWPLASDSEPTLAGLPENEPADPISLLTLADLRVVDASHLSWEHIREIRQDPIARERLRRLRLFAYGNYGDKSREFIEDDIQGRVADYEASAKEWGIQTVHGAISLAVNSKLVAGGLAGSLVAACFGQPVAAIVTGAVTAVAELGNIALEVKSKKIALDAMARENPISYITYAKERVERHQTANKTEHTNPLPRRESRDER